MFMVLAGNFLSLHSSLNLCVYVCYSCDTLLVNLRINRIICKLLIILYVSLPEQLNYIYILSDQQILKINHCINLFNNFKKIQTHKANSKSNYLHQHNVDLLLSLVSVITLAVTKNSKKEQPPPPPPSFFPLVSLSSF